MSANIMDNTSTVKLKLNYGKTSLCGRDGRKLCGPQCVILL